MELNRAGKYLPSASGAAGALRLWANERNNPRSLEVFSGPTAVLHVCREICTRLSAQETRRAETKAAPWWTIQTQDSEIHGEGVLRMCVCQSG